MALSKAALKDLLRQVPEFDETDLPTLEDKKAYVASQLDGTQKMIFRSLVEVEVAKEFASHKDENYQDNAKQKLEEAAQTLKAYKPTLKVLKELAVALEA
jgi:hypothetical protein